MTKKKASVEEESVKISKRLVIGVIAGFLVPITVIGLVISYVNNLNLPSAGTDAKSEQSVEQRIAPVAQVAINEAKAPATEESATLSDSSAEGANEGANGQAIAAAIAAISKDSSGATPARAGSADLAQAGKTLYGQICQTCHATGLLGAPKFGNKADWAPRLKSPLSEIYQYALQGKGSMPPKGGASASDDEVKAAVDYMLKAVK